MKKAWVLSYLLSAQQRLWSDWSDAQADLSLRRAHTHFVGFVMSQFIYMYMLSFLIGMKYVTCCVFQKYLMILIKGLCTGQSCLPKADIVTFTAMMKSAKRPQNIRYTENGSYSFNHHTIIILSLWTDRSRQTVYPQILQEQSDQGLHCLQFHLILFRIDTAVFFQVSKFVGFLPFIWI